MPTLDGRTYCRHGYDIAAFCLACTFPVTDRVDAYGDTQGDGRGCALVLLAAVLVVAVAVWVLA